jgi:hypothetical protein
MLYELFFFTSVAGGSDEKITGTGPAQCLPSKHVTDTGYLARHTVATLSCLNVYN